MRLNRFRLRTRIFLGFGLLIALLLGVAGFGSYGLSEVGQEIGKMDSIAGNLRRAQEVTYRLEVIRRGLTRYRIDADADSLKEVIGAEQRGLTLLAEAARFTISEPRRVLYNSAADKLRNLSAKRERFASLFVAAAAEAKGLNATGDKLNAELARLTEAAASSEDINAAAAVEVRVLAVRIANLRFQAAPDAELITAFRTAVAAATQALAALDQTASPKVKPLVQPIIVSLGLYVASFEKGASVRMESIDLYDKQIRVEIKELQDVVGQAEASLSSGMDETSRNAQTEASSTLAEQITFSAVGGILGVILALLIARSIIRPVNGMTAAMTRLAAGDTASEVPARENTDEIGEMARAVEVFRQQAIENLTLAAERERDRATKDRRQKAMDTYTQDFGSSVSGVMQSFMSSAAAMRQAASEVNEGARQTRASTSSTVEGATASARDLNSVAAAAEEMAVSINEISKQVVHVTNSVQSAVDRAAETDAKVAGLSDAADRIGDVVRIITDIAGQTNLLALNATIEAARAGDAGKGFAVVAGEVKALASQTARATEQIGAQIVAIRNATGEAVNAVRDVGVAIGQVETVAAAIAAAVEEQAAATREITNSVQMVTATTSTAAEAMREVLSIAEGTDTSSAAALKAANEVGQTADTLRTEVTDFLAAMSRSDEAERRLYERIPANGARATLRFAGKAVQDATIQDISRGGMAVRHDGDHPVGADVDIGLPGGGSIKGRVIRCADGLVGFAFRQDDTTLGRIDRALETIQQSAGRKAA